MKTSFVAKSLSIFEHEMYSKVQELGKQPGYLCGTLSRVVALSATLVDAPLAFCFPILVLIEQLASTAINYLGSLFGSEAFTAKDGSEIMEQLSKVVFSLDIPLYYLIFTCLFVKTLYTNLVDPKNPDALILSFRKKDPYQGPWVEYPQKINAQEAQLS